MQVEVVDQSQRLTAATQDVLERRLHFALARFDSRLEQVELAVNVQPAGPRGERWQCRLTVQVRGHEIMVSDQDERVTACVARAADRMARAVARNIARSHPADGRRPLTLE